MQKEEKLSLWESTSINIGTMIGASIFTLLGLGYHLAGNGIVIAYIIAGILSLMVAYSYIYFSKHVRSNAGPIAYILKSYKDNIFVGALSILYWMAFVISIALFAKGFGVYFFPLIGIESIILQRYIEVGIILLFALIVILGTKVVGKVEEYLVLLKLLILGVIIGVSLYIGNLHSLPETLIKNTSLQQILMVSAIFFLSYIGFGTITNEAQKVKNPSKNIPKSIVLSIIIVGILYILIALGVVININNLGITRISENILALIVEPLLGEIGYLLVSIGAIIAIMSGLNATIYSTANLAYALAKKGELPKKFNHKVMHNYEGYYVSLILAIIFTLFLNLEKVAQLTTIIYLILYLVVIAAHYKSHKTIGGNKYIIALNFLLVGAITAYFFYYLYVFEPFALLSTVIILIGSLILESIYRKSHGKKLHLENLIIETTKFLKFTEKQ